MSEGGGCARGEGRGAGRGTADASTGVRVGSGFEIGGDGLGDFAGAAFSVCFAFGVASSLSDFFPGVPLAFAFGFGVSSSSSVDFLDGDFFGFGVGESSFPSSLAGVFFAFVFGVGVGVAFFFDFDFRVAGFGVGFGVGVSDGVGEAAARLSSLAFFFFGSSLVCAWTKAPSIPVTARAVPRITRSRITGGERNRADRAINPEGLRG